MQTHVDFLIRTSEGGSRARSVVSRRRARGMGMAYCPRPAILSGGAAVARAQGRATPAEYRGRIQLQWRREQQPVPLGELHPSVPRPAMSQEEKATPRRQSSPFRHHASPTQRVLDIRSGAAMSRSTPRERVPSNYRSGIHCSSWRWGSMSASSMGQ
jgi:hypothetical protein